MRGGQKLLEPLGPSVNKAADLHQSALLQVRPALMVAR